MGCLEILFRGGKVGAKKNKYSERDKGGKGDEKDND